MRKLKLFFACLLMAVLSIGQMWADPAAAGTTLFSEDFSGYSANNVPSGSVTTATGRVVYGNANVTYSCTNGGSNTKIYAEALAGGASPEILIGKSTGTLTIAGIPSGGAKEITVSYKQNKQKLKVESTTTGYSGSKEEKPAAIGANSVDITVADGAAATFTLVFSCTGSSNVRVDDILVTVKTAGEGGGDTPPTPAKTLESVAVSGTPTKTSYTAGEDFDPAGLTVTGHYSEGPDEEITSGITWAYNPSQTLAENQTSIGVTATVSNIASDEFEVTGLTVAAAPAAVEYALFSGDLEEGDYVIYYDGKAMNNSIANNRLQYAEVTPSDNKITNPDASIVWHIAPSGNYWTIYSADAAKYAAGTGTKNQAQLLADGTDNKSLWTASGDATYEFENKANAAAGVNKTLRNNGTYGFACYATTTGGALSLYKKVDDQVAVAKPAIIGDAYFYASSEVSMLCTTEGAEIRYTLDGTDPTATSTLYENPFTLTEPTTVKAIAIKGADVSVIAEKVFTKATVKTVTEALAMSATEDVYVIGYISAITEVSTSFHNATYSISDDGTTTGEMLVYRGRYLNNADFTEENKNNIHVGDKVVVRGGLVEFQNAMQLAAGNYLVSIEYPEVAIPTFEPATESFLESVEVSLACSTEGAEIRYTLDGTDPTATSTLYENPFTLTETKTVKAIAIKGGTTTAVVSKTYTKQEIMTVADALASSAATGVYVKGIISTITEVSTGYKNATYRISDNGTTTDEMIVYRGRYINNTDFTSEDQIELGDEVVVYGNLVEFQSAMQLATGNYLISLVRKESAGLAWSAEAVELTVGDEFTAPTLTNPYEVSVSIASDNTELATVNEGIVSLVENATGMAKITATFAGNDQYKAAQVSYTITVNAATPTPVSYDYALVTDAAQLQDGLKVIIVAANEDKAAGSAAATYRYAVDVERTSEGDYLILDTENMPTEFTLGVPAAGQYTFNDGTGYMYENAAKSVKVQADPFSWSITIGDGNIATIQATNELRYNSGSPRFTTYASGQQALQLYVKDDGKQPAGLAWSADAVELTVGDEFNAPTLTNPNNLTVTIASDNTELATVNEGIVSLVENATGMAKITATFAGNDQYKAAQVSYTITVNAATPTPVSYDYALVTDAAQLQDGLKVIIVAANEDKAAGSAAATYRYAVDVERTSEGDYLILDTENMPTEFTLGVPAAGQYTFNDGTGYMYENAAKSVKVQADPFSWSITIGDGNIATIQATNELRYNSGSPRFTTYASGQQALQLYVKDDGKQPAGLAWSADAVELTVGDEFNAPTLTNPNNLTVTIASDNTELATVNEGIVSLVENATGTAKITASYAGDDTYRATSVSYIITVNAAPEPPTPLPDAEAKVIVVEYNSKFYAMSTTVKNSTGFEPIEVEKEGGKIIVKTNEEAAAIQWQIAIGESTATFQNSDNKYLACGSNSNTELVLLDAQSEWAWDADANCYKQPGKDNKGRTFYYNYNSGNPIFRAYTVAGIGADGYSGAPEFIAAENIEVHPQYETVRSGLIAGNYYTICYPKSMTDIQGATLWSFIGKDANLAYIQQETAATIEAGKPYIMYATASTVTAILGDETNAPGANGAIHGTFSDLTQEQLNTYATVAGSDLYLLIGNELRRATGDGTGSNTLPEYRAFVVVDEIGSAPAQMPAHVRSMPMHKDVATGFENLNATDKPVKLLIDGNIYILRGEKMYDATGRLVK